MVLTDDRREALLTTSLLMFPPSDAGLPYTKAGHTPNSRAEVITATECRCGWHIDILSAAGTASRSMHADPLDALDLDVSWEPRIERRAFFPGSADAGDHDGIHEGAVGLKSFESQDVK
jgi:hypothetical protein